LELERKASVSASSVATIEPIVNSRGLRNDAYFENVGIIPKRAIDRRYRKPNFLQLPYD